MCELNINSSKKSYTGYKVAIKIDGKYYSPAMGIEYKQNSDVAIPKYQRRIITFFVDGILESSVYEERMVGRTAVFCYKSRAKRLLFDMRRHIIDNDRLRFNGTGVLLKMKISSDLMEGFYEGSLILAGRHIDSFEEISEY